MNANNTLSYSDHNILLMTDSYKVGHWRQYPPGTQKVYSYFESRGGRYDSTIFFGLQYQLKKYLEGWQVSREKIDEAEELLAAHFQDKTVFNKKDWEYILNTYGGRLPISIKAVPEGTVVPTSNVLMTVENTDNRCYWLTNYLETLLSQLWYPSTVAAQSRDMKKTLLKYLEKTGTPSLVDFKLHDFGYRGVSCHEQAGIGGASHLLNFKGTDTLASIVLLKKFYNASMAGFSINASEHSTITGWGRWRENQALRNMLEQYPTGLVACVSDSYDIYNACDKIWGQELRELVLQRDGVLIIRPDSGDPLEVLPRILAILGKRFGTTWNEKGYLVLNPKVRVIQGDGIDYKSLETILECVTKAGWSADNIAFGSGGGLLQKVDRDTQKYAFKCSAIMINNEWNDVFKDPVTDPGKTSKRGRLGLYKEESGFYTHSATWKELYEDNYLIEVFRDGNVLVEYSLDEIRERCLLVA